MPVGEPFVKPPMELYEYEPIDLEKCSFRLIRLFKGDDGPIQCELFHAWLHDAEEVIEYEALSYTWGGTDKPYEIEVNGKRLPVTENLYLALQHLRHQDQDRILWIDAISIEQSNQKERGHQVRQMASIYKTAEQVIIWLGQAAAGTDLIFAYMHELEQQTLHHACNNWKASDERWQLLSSNVELSLNCVNEVSKCLYRHGFRTLLYQSWFRRVWILQEVANARSAKIMCGHKSVSARIFAITPPLLDITPDAHCQAVLDIMPGPSRKFSWWTGSRDLRTLLLKFGKSEASDPRDIIYALVGMSSDGCGTNILTPNYDKSVKKVMRDTVAFFLHIDDPKSIECGIRSWTLPKFLENLASLETVILSKATEKGHEELVKLLLENSKVDINSKHSFHRTPLSLAAENGHEAVVKLLLENSKVNINSKHSFHRTPLSLAAENGHEAVVKLLLENSKVNINSKHSFHRTPLSLAAENGHEAVVKLLLENSKVDINSKDIINRTPLALATQNGHEAVVKLLLNTGMVEVDFRDTHYGRTLLSWAAEKGHEAVVKLLLDTGKVNVNLRDDFNRTPLLWAAEKGHEAVVEVLLNKSNASVDLSDEYDQTPLSWAARNDHTAVAEVLLNKGNARVDLSDGDGQTPLSWAAQNENIAVVKLLLDTGKVHVHDRRNVLSWATQWSNEAIIKLLNTGLEDQLEDSEFSGSI